MLSIKPQGHWPFGSGEEDFWKIFTIYGRCGHLGHVIQTPQINFCSPIPLRLHMKSGFDWPSGFREEDLWKWWAMDDGPWLYYKLTNEPIGSGELTKWHVRLHPPSLTRVFPVHMKKAWVLSYPMSAQPRLIWVFVGRTCNFVGFIVRRLNYIVSSLINAPSHLFLRYKMPSKLALEHQNFLYLPKFYLKTVIFRTLELNGPPGHLLE